MSGILDLVLGQLAGGNVDQMASKIGADRKQTESAISAALPTMIEALGRSSSGQTSIDDLYRKLGVDRGTAAAAAPPPQSHAQPHVPVQQPQREAAGMSDILGGLFGQKKERIESSIGKNSGLSSSQVSSLIAMLGPMVLGALTNKAKANDSGNVHDVLQQERASIKKSGSASILGSLFDQDGDGDFDMADIMKLGMSQMFGKK